MEDAPLLVERFIAKLNRRKNKLIGGVDDQAMQLLLAHDYPGNIRELENIIEHAFVLCPEGLISARHLPAFLSLRSSPAPQSATIEDVVAASERDAIINDLRDNDDNSTASAAQLVCTRAPCFASSPNSASIYRTRTVAPRWLWPRHKQYYRELRSEDQTIENPAGNRRSRANAGSVRPTAEQSNDYGQQCRDTATGHLRH
jgi:hypothetical protein